MYFWNFRMDLHIIFEWIWDVASFKKCCNSAKITHSVVLNCCVTFSCSTRAPGSFDQSCVWEIYFRNEKKWAYCFQCEWRGLNILHITNWTPVRSMCSHRIMTNMTTYSFYSYSQKYSFYCFLHSCSSALQNSVILPYSHLDTFLELWKIYEMVREEMTVY